MNSGQSYDQTGIWVMFLVILSLAVDGLAFLIAVRDSDAALWSIPFLLAWQTVFFVYFFRQILPAYRRLPADRANDRMMYLFLFRLATVGPAIWAIAVWVAISVLSSGRF